MSVNGGWNQERGCNDCEDKDQNIDLTIALWRCGFFDFRRNEWWQLVRFQCGLFSAMRAVNVLPLHFHREGEMFTAALARAFGFRNGCIHAMKFKRLSAFVVQPKIIFQATTLQFSPCPKAFSWLVQL
jgi:hypothetical protein